MTADENIAEVLKRVEDDIRNGGAKPNGGHLPPLSAVGEENAKRLRDAADLVAQAVENQAAERLAVADSNVSDARALQDKAKKIAADIRAAAEVEAKRSIDVTCRMDDTSRLMEEFGQKFAQADHEPQT
jgi:hypothetical protein